jgi:HD-GYP domain-containing protein (c-di-GMP phosphodiesterase class II)
MQKNHNQKRSFFFKLNFWGQKCSTLNTYSSALFEANRHISHIIAGSGILFTLLSVPFLYITYHDKVFCMQVLGLTVVYFFPLWLSIPKKKSLLKLQHYLSPFLAIIVSLSISFFIGLYTINNTGLTVFCCVLVMLNILFIQPLFFQILLDGITVTIAIVLINHIPGFANAIPISFTLVITSLIGLVGGALVQRIQVNNVISNSRIHDSNKSIKEHSIASYRETNKQILATFSNFIDGKDTYTNGHLIRVAEYSYLLGKKLHYTSFDLDTLYYSALLHDVGKIAIPDAILNKTGHLTPEEYAIVKQHPLKGKEMLASFTALPGLDIGIAYHHERIDGKGYPLHLKGDEIPLNAQIIAVADTWDALTSSRIYRNDFTREEAISIMKKVAGSQLSSKLVSLFLQDKNIFDSKLCPEKLKKERLKTIASLLNQQIEKQYVTVLQDSQNE